MAGLFHRISLAAWAVPVILGVVYILTPANRQPLLPAIVLLFVLLTTTSVIARLGNIRLASLLITIILVTLGLFVNYTAAGEPRPGIVYSAWIIIVGGLLLGGREAVMIVIVFSAFQFVLTRLLLTNVIQPISVAPAAHIRDAVLFSGYLLVAATFNLALTSIRTSLSRYRKSEAELSKKNKELAELAHTLESRVQERTSALEKRASQLQTVSNVARSIATVQDINVLLSDITKLISDQFGFYHVGIFFIDENREYAYLSAANSPGGQKMLERQHRLKMDTTSIVGFVTSRGEPRIALDVGIDAVFFNNPDLPETRSEMALPLRAGGQVIGALDVQSTQANAFTDEDINILSILADQVAIAIENTRLFSESQAALLESQATIDKYLRQEWGNYTRQARQTGFLYDGKRVIPLDDGRQTEQRKNVIRTGRLSLEKVSSAVSIPIKLRGQTVGMIDVRSKSGQREWTQDEITLLEAAAERAALALENARLVETSQRRAARERAIGDISTKIGTFSEMNAILQTAVEELGRKIGGATEVTIELGEDDKRDHS